MTHLANRNLLALAAIAALAGCASRAPFELPDLDTRAPAGAQTTQPTPYPAYRYGYRPYGWYGYGQRSHGTDQPAGAGTPETPGTPGTSGAAPAPVVVEQPPPRPRSVERAPPERPARTTKAVDDTRPARRPAEQ